MSKGSNDVQLLVLIVFIFSLLVSCGSDNEGPTGPNQQTSPIIGGWQCTEREGFAIGGVGQDQMLITFALDSTWTSVEIESGNPPDTTTGAGDYVFESDTLTLASPGQPPTSDVFGCSVNAIRMDWRQIAGIDTVTWVFVRQ